MNFRSISLKLVKNVWNFRKSGKVWCRKMSGSAEKPQIASSVVPKTKEEEAENSKSVISETAEFGLTGCFAEFDDFNFDEKPEREKQLTNNELKEINFEKFKEKLEEVRKKNSALSATIGWDNPEKVRNYSDDLKKLETRGIPPFNPFTTRNRPLTNDSSIYDCNAWDDIKWDEEMETKAKEAVQNNSISAVDPERKEVLEKEANSFWDKFYDLHQNKFFRDRNWLFNEFPELESPYGSSVTSEESTLGTIEKRKGESYGGENSRFKVLEIGCGAGNTVFPLLLCNNNPETYVYCCDFSSTAVDIIKNHTNFEPKRCTPFVLDVTEENPVVPFPLGSIDVITSIFVLSAISPEKFDIAIRNLYRFLKPGGLLLFRDYGRYDMAQLRFKDGRCISDNFYVRGDGTRVYFFLEEEIEPLFEKQGFKKETIYVDRRLQVNRSRQLKMYRVWIQAKFRKSIETNQTDSLGS